MHVGGFPNWFQVRVERVSRVFAGPPLAVRKHYRTEAEYIAALDMVILCDERAPGPWRIRIGRSDNR